MIEMVTKTFCDRCGEEIEDATRLLNLRQPLIYEAPDYSLSGHICGDCIPSFKEWLKELTTQTI